MYAVKIIRVKWGYDQLMKLRIIAAVLIHVEYCRNMMDKSMWIFESCVCAYLFLYSTYYSMNTNIFFLGGEFLFYWLHIVSLLGWLYFNLISNHVPPTSIPSGPLNRTIYSFTISHKPMMPWQNPKPLSRPWTSNSGLKHCLIHSISSAHFNINCKIYNCSSGSNSN